MQDHQADGPRHERVALRRQIRGQGGARQSGNPGLLYRIGGATALFAAGANETVIRTMGRWSSDIHRLYVRACFEDCCEWTRRAGSAQVSDVAGTYDEVDYY